MATSVRKKIFFLVFCLASITQGMYSTYFVSILTTIERIYRIQSKTAGAIMSATELGQILGSLLIAYYGGRGNKPKWIAACMTLTALAALISTSPHFLLKSYSSSAHKLPYSSSDLSTDSPALMPALTQRNDLPNQDQLCYLNTDELTVLNSTHSSHSTVTQAHNTPMRDPIGPILVIFFVCLLAVGFGSTAITTLGPPLIDDIVSKEESPLYLGLTIGLRIFGPALGFLLGSFCIRLDVNMLVLNAALNEPNNAGQSHPSSTIIDPDTTGIGAWWLGLIMISLPLLILALPMYYLSRFSSSESNSVDDFKDITYQAAEDHDIGGSRDFEPHILNIGDLDMTSQRTYYSEVVDSSSREVLQTKCHASKFRYNYDKNIALEQPYITREDILSTTKGDPSDSWTTSCVVVNHFGELESTSFVNDEARSLHSSSYTSTASSSRKSAMNLSSSLSRLIENKLLLLRMLSGILHILPIAGFYTFLPKYLIEQYKIAHSSASAISGLAGILFVGLGAFLGGTIIRILNVNSKLMTRWIAVSALLYAIGMLILMSLGCSQNQTVHYGSSEFLSSDCLTSCRCSQHTYSPVCANGTTYMSACLAGCKSYTVAGDKIIYDECGCSAQPELGRPDHFNSNVATQGQCQVNCDNLKWYIIIFSIFTLIHASCEVGSMMFNLRCVKPNDRTLALGLITFASSLLGEFRLRRVYLFSMHYGNMQRLT